MTTRAQHTCGWLDGSGARGMGVCGKLAGRSFRVGPSPARELSWRCAKHSPLARNLRFVFLPFGIGGWRADTEAPADPIGWACQRMYGHVDNRYIPRPPVHR